MNEQITELEIKKALNALSFQFGDLKDYNRDFIFLDNPVHRKPFVKLENDATLENNSPANKYFSAITGVLPHFNMEILESLIENNELLKVKYVTKKAKYLEDRVEQLFQNAFPSGKIFTGSMWNESGSTVVYENDLILVIGAFAITIEAKSGAVTAPAKRGAPKRLFETLQELAEDPSMQAIRFMNFLQVNKTIHRFDTKDGKINRKDCSAIQYYIPIGVTLSSLGSLGSNLKKLIEAKVVSKNIEELAPSCSLTDLEVIFELLPL